MALQPLVCETGFKSGFWWNNSVIDAVSSGTMDPASLVALPCPRSESCLVSDTNRSVCVQGHAGVLCAQCSSGFGMSTGGVCGECFDPVVSWILVVIILSAVLVAGAFGVRRVLAKKPTVALPDERQRRDVTVTVKIMLNFIQTISFLGSFDLRWPPFVAGMFSSADSVSGMMFSTSLLSCALAWSPLGRFIAIAIFVPVLVLVPATAITIMSSRHREREFTRADEDEDYVPVPLALLGMTPMHLYASVIMVLLFLIYPTVTRQALEMLLCSNSIEGKTFLLADVSVTCDSPEYQSVANLAISVLGLITIGFPIASALLIWPFRHQLHSDKAQRRFGFLLKGYKDERFWYESVILLRKAAVATSAVLLRNQSSTLQLWAGLLVQLSFMVIHVTLRPYKHRGHDRLELGCMVAAIFLLVLGQGFLLSGIQDGGLTFLTMAVTAVVIGALAACLVLIGKDMWRYAAQAKIAEKVMEKWRKEQANGEDQDTEQGIGAAGTGDGIEVTASADSIIRKRSTFLSSITRATTLSGRDAKDAVQAAPPPGVAAAAAAAGLGMTFGQLVQVERTANRLFNRRKHIKAAAADGRIPGKSDVGGLASGLRMRMQQAATPQGIWKTNSLRTYVQEQEEAKERDSSASASNSSAKPSGRSLSRSASVLESVSNPLRRLRAETSASDVVPGTPDFATQRGLSRRRAGSSAHSLMSASAAAFASAAGAATPAGSGRLLQSSPWSTRNMTSMQAANRMKQAMQRRKRRKTLLPKSLRHRRAEVESRWKRALHAELNEPYWYNRQTRQIMWEQPEELDKLDEEEKAALEQWVRSEHPVKKAAFWKHPELGETWKRPHGVPLRPEEAWIRTAHPINNVPCFLNLLTQETTWERPEGYAFTHTKLMHPEIQTLWAALEARQREEAAAATV